MNQPPHTVNSEADRVLRILLVDDEPTARMILSRPLHKRGHHVTTASSGNEALELCKAEDFDLILLDISMQDGDGFLVLETLRSQETSRWIPVIVISGNQDENQITQALDLGADDYIVKPVNISFLIYKIRNFKRVITLQDENLQLLERVMQKQQQLEERLALEFDYSAKIQKTLLYGSLPLSAGGIFTSAMTRAAQGINGDFMEITSIYPDTVDIIMGDVMGKGPLAAILGADVKLQIQRIISNHLRQNPSERFTVAQIVNELHQTLTPKLIDLESFFTMCYTRIDKRNGVLTTVCCGHPPLMVLENDLVSEFGERNLPLGVLRDEVYAAQTRSIGPGTAVVTYSDGLSEAANEKREAFGEGPLQATLSAYQQSNWGANAILEKLFSAALNFIGNMPLTDDLTLIVAKVPEEHASGLRIKVPRELNYIGQVRDFVASLAPEFSLSQSTIDRMTLVAVECFTNTVRHSTSETMKSSIEVLVSRADNTIWLTLESLGERFDPTSITRPLDDAIDLSREGGFGLHIINGMADHVDYNHSNGVNSLKIGFNF